MWIPEWLGVPYCILYVKYGSKEFNFGDAQKELGIPTTNLLKVLSELGKHGFLISKTENRMTRYILSNFDSIAVGIKASKDFSKMSTPERLRKAYEEYGKKYLVIGSSAAFLYHLYQFPVKYEAEVFPRDFGFWSNLTPDVELTPTLNEKKFVERVEMDRLFVARPERVVAEGLKRGGISSALDSVSILVSENGLKYLQWKRLESYARKYHVVNELGAVLEVLASELMKEYGKSPIPKNFIDELFTHVRQFGRLKRYPKDVLEEDKTYSMIGEKWRLKLFLPSYVVRKAVEDVAPFALKVV